MFTLSQNRNETGKELRNAVFETLSSVMDANENVVCLEADLAGASKSSIVKEAHPDRYIQCGISEANMIGVAAGLSVEGFVPFVHTFAPFATRRVLDQLYLSGAYAIPSISMALILALQWHITAVRILLLKMCL